jgi:hypothetical protein
MGFRIAYRATFNGGTARSHNCAAFEDISSAEKSFEQRQGSRLPEERGVPSFCVQLEPQVLDNLAKQPRR